MYIVDLFKRLTKKSNVPVLIYLILNVFVIAAIVYYVIGFASYFTFWKSLLIGMELYAISLVLALSPFGEWILRLQTGCRKITRQEQIQFLMPLFTEVYARAKQLDPAVPDGVQLFINNDEDPNAFATGRKTICVTRGLLNMPEDQIKATLGHEFGHLAHKDTDLILVVSVGNLIVTAFILFIRGIIEFFHIGCWVVSLIFGGSDGVAAAAINEVFHMLITFAVVGLTWVWTQIGVLLVMKSSRSNEYAADEFSFHLGYGNSLCMLLDSICASNAKGLFATLASSHPDRDDRIAKLQELGCTYRATYGSNR